jgi:choline/ethanolamine phosphotransferase
VSLFPLWVAPNLITIIGLAINILTALVLMISCPTATERPPWWATLQCAAGLFLYQTLGEFPNFPALSKGLSVSDPD